jgi:hypothetical protein
MLIISHSLLQGKPPRQWPCTATGRPPGVGSDGSQRCLNTGLNMLIRHKQASSLWLVDGILSMLCSLVGARQAFTKKGRNLSALSLVTICLPSTSSLPNPSCPLAQAPFTPPPLPCFPPCRISLAPRTRGVYLSTPCSHRRCWIESIRG